MTSSIKVGAASTAVAMVAAIGVVAASGSSSAAPGTARSTEGAPPPPSQFAVLNERGSSAASLPDGARQAVAELGQGFERAIGSASSAPSRGSQAASDGAAIAAGEGEIHQVDHPAGLTLILVRQGQTLCTLETRVAGGAGACGSVAVDPAHPPVSVTQEDSGERLVALLADGVTDVVVTDVDGTRQPVEVVRNVAVARTTKALALSWTDRNKAPQRVVFLSAKADPGTEQAGRLQEVDELLNRRRGLRRTAGDRHSS